MPHELDRWAIKESMVHESDTAAASSRNAFVFDLAEDSEHEVAVLTTQEYWALEGLDNVTVARRFVNEGQPIRIRGATFFLEHNDPGGGQVFVSLNQHWEAATPGKPIRTVTSAAEKLPSNAGFHNVQVPDIEYTWGTGEDLYGLYELNNTGGDTTVTNNFIGRVRLYLSTAEAGASLSL